MAHHCFRRIVIQKQHIVLKYLQPKQPVYVSCATHKNKFSKIGFYEFDKKSGYQFTNKLTVTEKLKKGFELLPGEIKKFGKELKETFTDDQMVLYQANGDFEYFCKFNGKDSLEDWVLTTDRDNLEGSSRAYFTVSKDNKGLFYGYLCQEIPQDGLLTRTGYCSIRSPYNVISFQRQIPYDWSLFTHLILRVRGDGRPYLINILMDMFYDINWNDQYNYTLYTRGGPYWQVVKIPFSKFYLSSKGRIQDKQGPTIKSRVKNLCITIADGVEGPFKLEIDYIGLIYDENHKEVFAYEMYETKAHLVGT